MGTEFHRLLRALEVEHERQLAECRTTAFNESQNEVERPHVRQTISAGIHWCVHDQALAFNTSIGTDIGEDAPPSIAMEISEVKSVQNSEVAGEVEIDEVEMVEPESATAPVRRSSNSQHSCRFLDTEKKETAQTVLYLTSFLEGPGGVANYKKPLSSSPPCQIGWCCLWALYGAHSMYQGCRVLALMLTSNLDGDDLIAAMLFSSCSLVYAVTPVLVFKGKYISRCRAFAAAISTILSETRSAYLFDDLAKAVRLMQIRHFVGIVLYISMELILLFGPSRAPYRKLALWPWAQTDFVSVIHAIVSSLNCTVLFFPDTDLIMLTTVQHATQALKTDLEHSLVKAAHEKYDFLCDFLEDYFEVEANTLKYPFSGFCIVTLLLATVFVSQPDTHYLPYLLYVCTIFGAIFLKDMLTFADQNASIAALVDAVFKRRFYGLAAADSMEELHLRLCVTHRRPALVVFGFLEVTRSGIVGLMSFLLSIAFVIIFEMRT